MGKVDYTRVSSAERKDMTAKLATFILTAKDKSDMIKLLNQFLTRSELVMLGRRLLIAKELVKGLSQLEIRDKLKVGFSTIRSVEAWLEQTIPNYDEIRSRHSQHRSKIKNSTRIDLSQTFNYRYGRDTPLAILDFLLDNLTPPKKK